MQAYTEDMKFEDITFARDRATIAMPNGFICYVTYPHDGYLIHLTDINQTEYANSIMRKTGGKLSEQDVMDFLEYMQYLTPVKKDEVIPQITFTDQCWAMGFKLRFME